MFAMHTGNAARRGASKSRSGSKNTNKALLAVGCKDAKAAKMLGYKCPKNLYILYKTVGPSS